jgi:isoaspartyl peptidase/L-asparaginase-like protein (Ntn-hydrolase superfamily)
MYALAIHGGAGALARSELSAERQQLLRHGLLAALQAGERVLAGGGAALDAVQTAVVTLEDDPLFNAAHGAVLTREGSVELDAAIMDGATLRAGGVARVRRVRNPVSLAREILDRLPHVMLVGTPADEFAAELGLPLVPNDYFITPARRSQLAAVLTATPGPQPARTDVLGTVGAVACDQRGHLAAATSTGGTSGKRPGRVGDSPIIGAGTYADDRTCAVSATGHGEWLIRTVQAYDIAARLRYGAQSLPQAVEDAVRGRLARLKASAGLIAVDAGGQVAMSHNTETMLRAAVREGEQAVVAVI